MDISVLLLSIYFGIIHVLRSGFCMLKWVSQTQNFCWDRGNVVALFLGVTALAREKLGIWDFGLAPKR